MAQQTNPKDLPYLNTWQASLLISQIAMTFISTFFNLLLIMVVALDSKAGFRKSNLVFVTNLAFWDLTFSIYLLAISIRKIVIQKAYLDMIDCKIDSVANTSLGLCSLVAISLLALDRYFKVVKRRTITPISCFLVAFVSSAAAIVVGCSPLLFKNEDAFLLQPVGTYCMVNVYSRKVHPPDSSGAPMILFAITLSIIFACYFKLVMEILSSSKRLKKTPSMCSNAQYHSSQVFVHNLGPLHIGSHEQQSQSIPSQNSDREVTPLQKNGLKRSKVHSNVLLLSRTKSMMGNRAPGMKSAAKTILVGASHVFLYTPYGLLWFLQMLDTEQLEILDTIAAYSMYCCLILDPLWSLILDQNVKAKTQQLLTHFSK